MRRFYQPNPNRRLARGFTLIEAALVTIIVGVGTVATLQLLAAGSLSNRSSQELTTASNLANGIHELTLGMAFADPTSPTHWGVESGESSPAAYDDLDDLSGQTFSPPIDARRQRLDALSQWTQRITVQSVDPNRLGTDVPNGSSRAMRISVSILHNGRAICDRSWLAFDTQP